MKRKILALLTLLSVMTQTVRADDSDEFVQYNESAQYKEDEEKLEYIDIVSILKNAAQKEYVTSIKTIFDNRVVESNNLPSTNEGVEQSSSKDESSSSSTDSSSSSNESSGDYSSYKLTPGEFQGFYGGKSVEDIYKGQPVGFNVSSNMYKSAKEAAGTAVKFNERTDYNPPIPRYTQERGVEKWKNVNFTSVNLIDSGCWFYAVAHVFTAIEKKVINPAEMAVIMPFYGVVNQEGYFCDSSSEAGLNKLLETIGYKVTFYNKGDINDDIKKRIKDNLSKGIPQCIRTAYFGGPQFSSHFMCLETYDASTDTYTVAQAPSSRDDKKAYKFEDIAKYFYTSTRCLYLIEKK